MNIDPDSPLGRKCLDLAGVPVAPSPKRERVAEPTHNPGWASGWAVEFVIPWRPVSESNTGGPLGAKLGRKRVAKAAADAAIPPALPPVPVRVTLTRLGGQTRIDGDNLQSAMKVIRDAVSAALGVDDGDRGKVTFVCRQRPAYGACRVLVRVESR